MLLDPSPQALSRRLTGPQVVIPFPPLLSAPGVSLEISSWFNHGMSVYLLAHP